MALSKVADVSDGAQTSCQLIDLQRNTVVFLQTNLHAVRPDCWYFRQSRPSLDSVTRIFPVRRPHPRERCWESSPPIAPVSDDLFAEHESVQIRPLQTKMTEIAEYCDVDFKKRVEVA